MTKVKKSKKMTVSQSKSQHFLAQKLGESVRYLLSLSGYFEYVSIYKLSQSKFKSELGNKLEARVTLFEHLILDPSGHRIAKVTIKGSVMHKIDQSLNSQIMTCIRGLKNEFPQF